MNLLDQSGLQGALDDKFTIKESTAYLNEKIDMNPVVKKTNTRYFNKKNNYKNIVIVSLLLFLIFCLYVLSNRKNFNPEYDYKFLSLTNNIYSIDNLYIKSLSIKNNNLSIVAETNEQKKIYKYLPMIEDIFSNVKLKIDKSLSQIWINQDFEIFNNKGILVFFSFLIALSASSKSLSFC